MSNANVGVNLKEGKALSPIEGVSTAISGLIGNFVKGPLHEATLVTSMAAFERIFGTEPAPGSTSYYSVKAFFAKINNAQLWVIRVASSTAALATASFDDRGVPASTLRIDAKSEGIWGNDLGVKVLDDNILTTTLSADIAIAATQAPLTSVEGIEVGSYVNLDDSTNSEYVTVIQVDIPNKIIFWTGGLTFGYTAVLTAVTTLEFELEVYVKGVLVETWPGLSMRDEVTFFVEKAIGETSDYIRAVDLKVSDTDYQDLPVATSTPTALATGANGLADVVQSDYEGVQSTKTGKYGFDAVEDLFRFCIPNPVLTDADIPAALIGLTQNMLDYATARVTLTFYGDVPYGNIPTAAKTFGDNFAGRLLNLWYPWGGAMESGLKSWIPQSSLVIAAAVEKDYRRGVHKNVGNESLPYFTELEYYVSVAEGELLNDAGINTVRKFAKGGIRTYGGRTKSALTAWRFLNHSELWNYIGRSLALGTRDVPFEPHDEFLWKSIIRRFNAFLATEQSRGALFDVSNPGGPAYLVLMDGTINPPDQVALGKALTKVEYVPTGVAEKFIIELTSSPSGLTLSGGQG